MDSLRRNTETPLHAAFTTRASDRSTATAFVVHGIGPAWTRWPGATARAESLMLHHLDHIEGSLQLDNGNGEVDLEAIFRS